MFEIELNTEFCAAHAIEMRGEREPLHGHNWRIRAVIGAERLDEDGLVCDFHRIEAALGEIVARFDAGNLNETPPFDRVNPTAERVAEHIGTTLAASLPGTVRLVSVRVTEAPNCAAIFRPAG